MNYPAKAFTGLFKTLVISGRGDSVSVAPFAAPLTHAAASTVALHHRRIPKTCINTHEDPAILAVFRRQKIPDCAV
ncbi:TPA_asm: hypothetical protein G0G78_23860 [Salmonella enterica]|nr:hypothetical protein [Salmonella enterica]EAO7618856.1 hypothetical protein [Salmonella enterica]EAQ6819079.1 hypothetical protein [Salmonella enterica]EAU9427247.1 hypothetical protein [Salmonella enterica]MIV19574.1 hypothetical protein [Salmonella enterica]